VLRRAVTRFHFVKLVFPEDFVAELGRSERLFAATFFLHHGRHVLLVEVTDFFYAFTEHQQRGNDFAGTCAEDQIEFLVERALHHALDLAQHAKRVEPFSPTTIEAEGSTGLLLRKVDHPSLPIASGQLLLR